MKTSLTITFLSLLLLIGPLGKAVCAQQPAADVEKTTKVKSEVAKRVTNKKTRVKIKLHNGDELKITEGLPHNCAEKFMSESPSISAGALGTMSGGIR